MGKFSVLTHNGIAWLEFEFANGAMRFSHADLKEKGRDGVLRVLGLARAPANHQKIADALMEAKEVLDHMPASGSGSCPLCGSGPV